MTSVRRIFAAAVVAGTLAVLPISVIANDVQTAGGAAGNTKITVTIMGGQGNWPFKP